MSIYIEPVELSMLKEIFEFEQANKSYFERILPPRPVGYQTYDSFISILTDLLEEQANGTYYMYVIRDDMTQLIGRINLNITDYKADLGYRIGQEYGGKGYASQAVKCILDQAFNDLKIIEITAGTSTENIASQRVLEKNGFTRIGEEKDVMKINNHFVDGYLYAIKNKGQ